MIGDQVYINYGGQCNEDFALLYGFIPTQVGTHRSMAAAELTGALTAEQSLMLKADINSPRALDRINENVDRAIRLAHEGLQDTKFLVQLNPSGLADVLMLCDIAYAAVSALA